MKIKPVFSVGDTVCISFGTYEGVRGKIVCAYMLVADDEDDENLDLYVVELPIVDGKAYQFRATVDMITRLQ
jgi:hypothetical protein